MIRKLSVMAVVVMLVLSMLPVSALADIDPTPLTYRTADFNKMQAFLEIADEGGIKNGVKLNAAYDKDDPDTWTGVSWYEPPLNDPCSITEVGEMGEWCDKGLVGDLDLSGLTDLTEVYCYDNQITGVDMSGCTSFRYLYCNANAITSVDVTGCPLLTHLNCSYNQISTIDVSENSALEWLFVCDNQLTSIDVSGCPQLLDLDCFMNAITSIDVTGCPSLTELDCRKNQLSTIDVSENTALQWLMLWGNELTSIDVSACANLDVFDIGNNQLTSVDITDLNGLWGFGCDGNDISAIDFSGNPVLDTVYCCDCSLTTLDMSSNPLLYTLDCSGNELTTLDLSANTALVRLYCEDNPLTQITANIAGGSICLDAGRDGYVSLYSGYGDGGVQDGLTQYTHSAELPQPQRQLDKVISACAIPCETAAFVEWTGTFTYGEPTLPEPLAAYKTAPEPPFDDAKISLLAGSDYELTANFMSITPSREDRTVYQNGRITLTPTVPGGTWGFDTSKVSGTLSGDDLVLCGIAVGTTRVTYTISGDPDKVTYIDIIVSDADLPSTGQDYTLVYVLCGLGLAALAGALWFMSKRRVRA